MIPGYVGKGVVANTIRPHSILHDTLYMLTVPHCKRFIYSTNFFVENLNERITYL